MKHEAEVKPGPTAEQAPAAPSNPQPEAAPIEANRREGSTFKKRNLLRSLIDSVPDHIYVKDTKSRFVLANVALARHMGVESPAELVGRTDFDFYPEELAAKYCADERAVIESGAPCINHEEPGTDRAGNKMCFLTTKVPLRSAAGNVVAIVGTSRDITEQKRAEEALGEERNLLRTLIDNFLDPICVKDREGRFILANPAFARHVGATAPEEVIGKTDFEFFPMEVAAHYRSSDQEVIRSGKAVLNSEEVGLNRQGTRVWTLTTRVPLRDAGGRIIGLVVVSRDIGELRRAEESLRASEALYHSLVESIPMSVFRKDLEGRFIFGNTLFCKALGRPFEEIVGRTDFDFFPKELAEKYRHDDQEVGETGRIFEDIEEHQKPDGERIYVQVFKTPVRNFDGEIMGTQGIFWDVTDRKRAQEELVQERYLMDSLMDNLPDSIYFKDAQSRFTKINKALAQSFGLGDPSHALGKTDFDFFTEEHARPAFEDEQQIMRSDQPLVAKEEKETRLDGTVRWASTTKMPLRDKDGKTIGTFGVSRDVTDRKLAEDELKRTAAELARSNAELEQFAYVASHDLQEPLRMVASYTQLLAKRYQGKLDPDGDDFVAFVVDGATRMQTLINDLLTYSRVGTRGKAFEPADCETMLRRALANLQIAIEETGAAVTHDNLPTVMADEMQLCQLLQNVIGNAIKFHGEQPPWVHVSAKKEGNDWLFSVRDNGIGIDPAYFERIFIIFQRLHNRGEYAGTGIGLAICKKIVERHGGRIWVESEPGKGSTFYFTIPEKGGE